MQRETAGLVSLSISVEPNSGTICALSERSYRSKAAFLRLART